jgi:two-component system chemotaxis response regulator CheY
MPHQEDEAFTAWITGKSFMVVEDMTSSRMLVAGLLRSLGAKSVQAATDGRDALAKLSHSEHAPDVIVCDWVMPGMDGLALLDETKARFPSAKFVMLTAKTEPSDIELARNHGVDGYIAKPFSREGLVMALKRLQASISSAGP